jgi:hypothetical protein
VVKQSNIQTPSKAGAYIVDTSCGLDKYAADFSVTPMLIKDYASVFGKGGSTLVGNTPAFTVDNLEPESNYNINVVAICDTNCNNGGSERVVAYRSVAVKTAVAGGSKSFNIIFIIVGVVILVPLLAVAVRFYCKNRALEKKLQYEMHDVRNIARVDEVSPASKNFGVNAYSSLLETGNPLDSPPEIKKSTGTGGYMSSTIL